jgi:cellulase/cellobiase CelA1
MAAQAVAFFGLTGGGPTSSPTAGPSGNPPSGPPSSGPPSSGPPPGGTACRVTGTVNAWGTGLTENLTIENTGTSSINGWSLAFTLPGGQTITSGWNATYSPTSGQVTARNVGHNATIAAGRSISIGFQAGHTGNTGKPASFTLNSTSCAVA